MTAARQEAGAASLTALRRLEGGLVVSCQAPDGHPLRETSVIARLAQAAALGGAAGLRVNTAADVRAVRAVTGLPVIGIRKVARGSRQLITPTLRLAEELAAAGADIIAVEATADLAPAGGDTAALVAAAVAALDVPVMADVATAAEGLAAWQAGAQLVATTLAGYAGQRNGSHDASGPDLDLLAALHDRGVRVVGEGRYSTPGQVAAAFERGAYAVVVGTAITDPVAITRRFVSAVPQAAGSTGRSAP